MKVFNEETGDSKKPSACLLLLGRDEAKLLIEMAGVACDAKKTRPTFRKMREKLERTLAVY